jgi:hypothetical protein
VFQGILAWTLDVFLVLGPRYKSLDMSRAPGLCSRESLLNAWVDPWSLTLVDKTPGLFLGLLDFNQVLDGT